MSKNEFNGCLECGCPDNCDLKIENLKLKKALDKWLSYAEAVCDGMPESNLDRRFIEAIEASK